MMDDVEFLSELRQMVMRSAEANNLVDTMAFVSEVAERLEEDPVFGDFVQVEYIGTGNGRGRPKLRLHGYTQLDESDGSLGLVIGSWEDSDSIEVLSTATVGHLFSWLESFVVESINLKLNERITESNPAYEVASILRNSKSNISRIRLHLFSNQMLSQKFSKELTGEIAGIPLEKHIWDFRRLKAMYESSREREAVEIQVSDFSSTGIPYIEASYTDRLTSYLCVVDAGLLADLFERYGSRLLEGNVRSFLGMKGGVNKGIRATIQDSPNLFFAYNNGIAATAADVVIENGSGMKRITGFVDLQIVNGGQTTASILNARKSGLSLQGVTVQMKLTRINHTDAHDLIPKIAQFANTQNKVAIADFFANHPFHRKMEEISRRLQVPARVGDRIQSKWFYERSRGQYQNERLYLTKSKKDAFDLEYPNNQVINKTQLAKYDSVWRTKPHWVSLGAQKNFAKFAGQFSSSKQDVTETEHWAAISPCFGDNYYQQMVAAAILWHRTEKIVSAGRGTWYEGDYRPQIVAYSLSVFFNAARMGGREIDLDKIWLKQDIDSRIERTIEQIAIKVQPLLLEPPAGTSNVGEWCKKEICWEKISASVTPNLEGVEDWLVEKEDFSRNQSDGRKRGKQDDGIAVQKKVLDCVLNGYWLALAGWPLLDRFLSPPEHVLVLKVSTVIGFNKVNTEKDWRHLMEIKNRCELEGFRHSL